MPLGMDICPVFTLQFTYEYLMEGCVIAEKQPPSLTEFCQQVELYADIYCMAAFTVDSLTIVDTFRTSLSSLLTSKNTPALYVILHTRRLSCGS